MDNQTIQTLIQEADQLINTAESEMNRSEEDVVTHLVCHTSRKALSNYLKAYLLQHGVHSTEHASLEDLLNKCRDRNPLFHDVDLSNIHCRFDHHDDEFCLSHHQVDYCLTVANKVKMIIEK